MNKRKLIFAFIMLAAALSLQAQGYRITGRILDTKTNKPLSFASMKVIETGSGTTADGNGEFILYVNEGSISVVTSYIGYFTDTSSFFIEGKNEERNIYLKPTDIFTEVIEVAGEDPAYEIIRKAIKYKQEFKKGLEEYNYDAYTKFVAKSNINLYNDSLIKKDSTGMNIAGILESETTGYFKKPDNEKQIVKAKRETANITRGFAIPFIVNFYDEAIDLGDNRVPGPVADDEFDYYEYKLLGTTSIDSTTVFKIEVKNTSALRPQFMGSIYVIDSLFALIKVDLQTNSEVIKGVNKLAFRQKFTQETDSKSKKFWMPTDVEISGEGRFAGVVKVKIDVFTIITDYRLNEKAPSGIWDEVIIKVEKLAEKDSSYWNKNRMIKNTQEEKNAYTAIENSIKNKPDITIGLSGINFGKNLSLDLLETYKFNSVTGHQVGFKLNYSKDFGRVNSGLYYGYGFSDKKAKIKFDFATQLLRDRSLRLNFSGGSYLFSPFMRRTLMDDLLNLLYTLGTKKDRYAYYNFEGFSANIVKGIIPQLSIGFGYYQADRTSAKVNTDFSIIPRDNAYSVQPVINDDFRRSLSVAIRIDPNSYRAIDWGDGDYTRFRSTGFPYITLMYENASKSFLSSTFDNRKYSIEVYGSNNFSSRIRPTYKMGFKYMNGTIPYQDLLFFDVFKTTDDAMTFAAMDYNEFAGTELAYFSIENNFGKFIPRSIPLLNTMELILFFNAGRSVISDDAQKMLLNNFVKGTDGTMLEAGFALANVLDVVRLNFGWRLNNYKSGSNFIFYLSFF